MALYLPVKTDRSYQGSCVGRFFDARTEHVASVEGHNIVFEQFGAADENSMMSYMTVRVVAQGQIMKLLAIPQSQSSKDSSASRALDLLCIYTRVHLGDKCTDVIYIKSYDKNNNELVDVTVLRCSIPSDWPQLAEIAICREDGPNLGAILVTNGYEGKTFMLDPQHEFAVTDISFDASLAGNWALYWLNGTVAAAIHHTKFREVLHPFRVNRATKYKAGPGLALKKLQNKIKSTPGRILGIFTLGTDSDKAFVMFADSVTELKITNNNIDEGKFKHLGVPNERGRSWYLLGRSSPGNLVLVSSLLDAFLVQPKLKITRMYSEFSGYSVLKQLSAFGHFLLSRDISGERFICKVECEGRSLNRISMHPFQLQVPGGEKHGLITHRFDKDFGSNFVEYQGHVGKSRSLQILHRMSKSHLRPVGRNDWIIKGIWVVNRDPFTLFASSATESAIIKVTGSPSSIQLTYEAIPKWMESGSDTIFASEKLQITSERVISAGNAMESSKHELHLATAGSDLAYAVSGRSLFVYSNTSELQQISFSDVIVEISEQDGELLVLTSAALNICKTFEGKVNIQSTVPITKNRAPTCLLRVSNDEIYIGLTNGNVLSTKTLLEKRVSGGSINQLALLDHDHILALGAEELTIYDRTTGIVDKCAFGSFTDFIRYRDTPLAFVVNDGKLELLKLNFGVQYKTQGPPLAEYSSNAAKSIMLGSTLYILDAGKRVLTKCNMKDPVRSNITVAFPSGQNNSVVSQLFLVNETLILEVCHAVSENHDNDDSTNDDNDEEYEVPLTFKLYYLVEVPGSGASLKEVYRATKTLVGDPFDEVVVKFMTNTRVIVFTHSVQCVSMEIDEQHKTLSLGDSKDAEDFVYDDHWLYDKDSDSLNVIDFNGHVYSLSGSQLQDNVYPISDEAAPSIFGDAKEMVFDAIRLEHSNSGSQRFAISHKRPDSSTFSGLKIVDLVSQSNEVFTIASLTVPCRDISISAVNNNYEEFLNQEKFKTTRYLTSLNPDVFVETASGSIYLVCTIKDRQFSSVLAAVQEELFTSFGFLEPFYKLSGGDASTVSVIDGLLLMEALENPAARDTFRKRGINPEDLYRCLNILTT